MEEEQIRQKWAEYFEKLGTPACVDSEKSKLVKEMREACNAEEEPISITDELVKQAINRLNSNKAADIYGLAAEHLKFMSDSSILSLTSVISNIINDGPVPELLKKSYKINIPKKNKDARIQDNHRGITVAPIIGKLLEVIADMLGLMKLPQNRLQFGFSHGRSPAMCSVIITEAISEARALKIPLISSSEDARKAFDVVDQDRLKCKLYHTDMPKKIWRLIDDLYTGGTEQFQYKGELSSPYTILQGVKQGGIDSPPLYKFYIYNMLQQLEEEGLGLHIGALYLGSPTCADDVDLLSNDHTGSETQQMLSLTKDYSHVHKYTIHHTKSTNTILYEPKKMPVERKEWYISEVPMPLAKEFVHLGLTWMEGKTKPDLDVNLSSARRTSYRLMGKGFHGGDGLNPVVSNKLIKCYVIPRLLHGLEATVLNGSDITKLEKYYRRLLKQLQNLPDSTANCATYLLLGNIPLEGVWHQRILSLFGNISRLGKDHTLYRLAARQMSFSENERPNSWFTQVAKVARMYGIDAIKNLADPLPKEAWKQKIKNSISSYWKLSLLKEAKERSTLKWFLFDAADSPHGIWNACRKCPHLVSAAAARAKAITGRLCINEHSWRESNECPLCGAENETTSHFLLECPQL